MRLIFDLESNGLLDELDRIHCMVIQDIDDPNRTFLQFADQPGYSPISEGIAMLNEAEEIVGHNIIRFDIPAIQKVAPTFDPRGRVLDTLVLSRLFWPEIKINDADRIAKGKLAKKHFGRYSLEAFGARLGEDKGDYSDIMKARGLDPWAEWNQEMQDYNVQDVVVNRKLYDYALKVWAGEDSRGCGIPYSDESVWMEMDVATIVARQEARGFAFNVEKAQRLYATLIREREELQEVAAQAFPPWWARDGAVTTPKRARRVKLKDFPPIGYDKKGEPIYPLCHYSPDAPYQKIKLVEFNPNSSLHIEDRFKTKYRWKPQELTPTGRAKLDETILQDLPFPEAKPLVEYQTVAKRIGQLAEGNQAWLKKERGGIIYGAVNTLGAVTRRMTHSNPNLAQVPAVRKTDEGILLMKEGGYGAECRELFEAREGYVLVGCDADALELRCLAGYMARYDGGEYIRTVLSGNKELGTDMHSVNCRALGMDPTKVYPTPKGPQVGRDIAKTWF